MALTGLFLVLFIVEHMVGNLLLLLPDEGAIYNQYSYFLVTFPLIRIVEVVLFVSIFAHIGYAVVITIRNRKARPVGYATTNASANSTWISRNMGFLGIILLIFLIIHLNAFFAQARIMHTMDMVVINGIEMHDVYSAVKAKFEVWWYVVIYMVGFIALAAHLWHGFQSGFRTLGARHPKYLPLVKGIGYFISIVVPLGFAVVPLFFYLKSIL